ncbi:PINIT domain-containing protein [Circinella umbellata]|nr:PINIT domain-containing protein [Circinella umbellata]
MANRILTARNTDQENVINYVLRSAIGQSIKVDDLKSIIRQLNSSTAFSRRLPVSGNKSVLIDRIVGFIASSMRSGIYNEVDSAIAILNRTHTYFQWTYNNGTFSVVPRATRIMSTTNRQNPLLLLQRQQHQQRQQQQNRTMSVSDRQTQYVTSAVYKYGPYFEVVKELTRQAVCPVSVHARTQHIFSFSLSTQEQEQIRSNTHEIRVFCSRYSDTNQPQVIEFPEICEIQVNSEPVFSGQNLRGIKGSPGTIHPPNISRHIRVGEGTQTVQLSYVTSSSRFVACIRLVRRHTVESLVENLIETRNIDKNEVLEKFEQQQEESDIVIDSETLSMKCPLGFTRIQTPIRSKTCSHAQCFEAFTFLKMNEQTPTWTCPKCSRSINSYEDLFVDGYFRDLLETVGKKADIVRIGASGVLQQVKEESDMSDSSSTPDPSSSHSVKRSASAATETAITILDNDDDDHEIVGMDRETTKGIKRRASEELVCNSSYIQRPRPNVIDLTLSDDDDEEVNNNNNNNSDRGSMYTRDNNISNNSTITTATTTTGQLIDPRPPSSVPLLAHSSLSPMVPVSMVQPPRPITVIASQPPNTTATISAVTGAVLATSQNTSNNTTTNNNINNNNVNTTPSS